MQSFENVLDQKLLKYAQVVDESSKMFTNFEITNLRNSEDVEIDGEIMLLRIHDYLPTAKSAIANIARKAGKFVCHFEVWSDKDLFIVEAASANVRLCLQMVERKMLEKFGLKFQAA